MDKIEYSKFFQNLFSYIIELGYNQRQIANKIGVTEASLSRYLSGQRIPKGDILLKIILEFNISSDTINSLMNDNIDKSKEINYDELICRLFRLNNLHITEISKMIDMYLELQEYDSMKKQIKMLYN